MKRVNSQIRLRTCGCFMSLAIALVITLGANPAGAVHFPDYLPVDPEEHGIKTFEFTYGLSGQFTSEIIGTETVPYTSGGITGVKISNFPYGTTGIMYNDGVCVKHLGFDDYYVSTDCSLTAHPSAHSYCTLNDGDLLDLGEYYVVKNDLSTCDMVDNQGILVSIQDVSVLHGNYQDAVIFWWLDTKGTFTALNLHGKESDLGITLPTTSDTGGHAVVGFGIRGFETGTIAFGEIDPSTGSLNYLYELKEITYPFSFTGWIWMEIGGDFGYSLDEGNWLYFYSSTPVLNYNITKGQWDPVGPVGLIYVDWPFYYVFVTNCLMFAIPPESGLWVYHFSTGEWTVLPRIIPFLISEKTTKAVLNKQGLVYNY